MAHLTLGWKVNKSREPIYWVAPASPKRPGLQTPADLVTVNAVAAANHTVIIAQSGSGKSFFLGRLIEELLLETRARCLILDPNGDFRKVAEIQHSGMWDRAAYDRDCSGGWLPHEPSQAHFANRWAQVSKAFRRVSPLVVSGWKPLRVWWPSVPLHLLGEGVDPLVSAALYHCHSFVRAVATLAEVRSIAEREWSEKEVLSWSEDLLGRNSDAARRELRNFNSPDMIEAVVAQPPVDSVELAGFALRGSEVDVSLKRSFITLVVSTAISTAARSLRYVASGREFYFARVREFQEANILISTVAEAKIARETAPPRLDVIDLPMLETNVRSVVVSTVLNNEWERAQQLWSQAMEESPSGDRRAPVFIVVDEAHNLIPASPRGRVEAAVREQFRTIVAEGRKYGMFLLLVTQRPDKLDPLVLSECENKALMRLSGPPVLTIARELLRLGDVPPKILEASLEFGPGRALLVGEWATDGPQVLYCAARRTVEGGRNIRSEHWATPV